MMMADYHQIIDRHYNILSQLNKGPGPSATKEYFLFDTDGDASILQKNHKVDGSDKDS